MWQQMACRIDGNGYVSVPLSRLGKQKVRLVHRVVWEAFKGPIPRKPRKLEINHKNGIKIDNRLKNLELVTHRKNMEHGFRELNFSRNRTKGAIHPKAKLWEEDVKKILELRAAGIRRHVVADQFNVSDVAIRLIEKGDNWRHLTGLARSEAPAFASPSSQGEGNSMSKLKAADIPKIFEMSREGMSQQKIAKHFGVNHQAINKILLGLRWKHVTDKLRKAAAAKAKAPAKTKTPAARKRAAKRGG
jgi:DNA-binding XRE family transcriptional regulator